MSDPEPPPDDTSSSPPHGHVPVLVEPVLEHLAPRPGGIVLDATLGRGGHAERIIPALAPGGRYVGLDVDPANVAYARDRLNPVAAGAGVELDVLHANFQDARAVCDELNVDRIDGLLADLGFASSQIDDPARGLSFREAAAGDRAAPASDAGGPLDMRLDPSQPTTAADLINRLPERELADLIYLGGEEPMSRRIARKIVETRRERPIKTTTELSELVRRAYGRRAHRSRMHPATRTFMALRIAVNSELEALDRLLEALPQLLSGGGRAVFISFHSLEDRRVKQAFQRYATAGLGERLTRKPVAPSDAERHANPRSRSAKLRALRWRPDAEREG